MTKVCFFTTTPLHRLPYEQYTYNDLQILKKLGFQVVIASTILQIPLDCDFIFSWWVSGSFFPAIISFLFRKPLFIVAGGNEVNLAIPPPFNACFGYFSYSPIKRLCIRFSLFAASRIFPVSHYIYESIRSLSFSSSSKCVVVHNAVDMRFFGPPRNAIVASDSRYTIACIASLDDQSLVIKRVPELIDAFSKAVKLNSSLHLLLIGRTGSSQGSIPSLLRKLPAGSYTLLLNVERSEIKAYLSSANVYCQPSVVETFGLAAMEAAAMGLPLILSSGGALTEIFNGSAIFIPEPFSVEMLAQIFVDSAEGKICFPCHSLQYLDEHYSLDARLRALSTYLPVPL